MTMQIQDRLNCDVSSQSQSLGQTWCSLAWRKCASSAVSILACPLVLVTSIPKVESFSGIRHVHWFDPHRSLTNRCCPRCCFLTFPTHFLTDRPTSCRLLIPSCLRAFLIPSNCVGRLGNPLKSFLYWDRTLQQGSYSPSANTHTHAGRVNPGQANMHSWTGDRLLKNYPATPTHELSQHTQKENPTQHIVPFPLWAPICGWLRNSKGVIRLSLYKHAARKKERGRRNGTDQVRNSSNSSQKDKEI